MKVLVTGGAGFVGSAFVRHLLATTDDTVTSFDALTYAGAAQNLAEVDPHRHQLVVGDVADRLAVRAAIEGHDAVVHLAAESHVDRSLLAPDVFVRTNCTGTNVVCDEARRAGVGRFLHASTDEVYGPVREGSVTEAAPLRPSSPYSGSKAGSDLIALSHHASHGLPVVVTRSSNQYGPRQFPEKLIPHFVARLLSGEDVPLYGDGLHVRDWMHVDDGCAALARVLCDGEPGEVYNVSAHEARPNRVLAEAIVDLLGVDRTRIVAVPDRPGHDRRYSVGADRVVALGWAPQRGFEEGLEATVRWYVDNRAWWEPRLAHVRNR